MKIFLIFLFCPFLIHAEDSFECVRKITRTQIGHKLKSFVADSGFDLSAEESKGIQDEAKVKEIQDKNNILRALRRGQKV